MICCKLFFSNYAGMPFCAPGALLFYLSQILGSFSITNPFLVSPFSFSTFKFPLRLPFDWSVSYLVELFALLALNRCYPKPFKKCVGKAVDSQSLSPFLKINKNPLRTPLGLFWEWTRVFFCFSTINCFTSLLTFCPVPKNLFGTLFIRLIVLVEL